MSNLLHNHQYTNISSNIDYQIPNINRSESYPIYVNIPSPEQKVSILFYNILENNSSQILNYLKIPELSILRGMNKKLRQIINKYYIFRLNLEYNDIKNFEKNNQSKLEEFLKIYELQVPLSTNNWFYYNIEKAIDTILKIDRKTIAQLRLIKNNKNLNEIVYAPFCYIFHYNQKNEEFGKNEWKKKADSIILDSKLFINIANLKYENFEDEDILNAFAYLNEIESNIDKINRYSFALHEINEWCKAVVIYHILVHPYQYRNIQNSIPINSEIFKYITFMDELINKFYLFKGYLEMKKIIKPRLGEYVFTLYKYKIGNIDDKNKNENFREINNEKININNENIIGNILSYLPLKECFKFMKVSKFGFNCFKKSLNILCDNILKKIFMLKYYNFNDLYSLVPTIFENNIFSNYFSMLEDIINPSFNCKNSKLNIIPFLTKEDINDIKNYKGNSELIYSISKIFCIVFNIKSEKILGQDFNFIYLYVKSIILLCFKGNLTKLIKYFNIYNLSNNQIRALYEELSNLYSIEKIKKVKSINKGFYQLLLWELYLFEYIKQFNPFLFIDKNLFFNNELLEENQKNIINIYIDLMEQLKYILNFKYHFENLFLSKNKKSSYDFISIISNMIKTLNENNKYENIKYIIDTYNIKQKNISKAYFYCINNIENKDRPFLYRKIMEELILINVEMVNSNKENNNNHYKNNINNGINIDIEIKDENYYINNFMQVNNKTINDNFGISNKLFKVKNNNNNTNRLKSKNNKNNSVNSFRNKNKINNYLNSDYDINKYSVRQININNIPNNKNNIINKIFTPQNIKKNNSIFNLNDISKSFTFKKNYHFNIQNNNNYINDSKNYIYNYNNGNFFDIPEDILITKILFYLSIYDFNQLSLVNKFFYKSIKTHIYIRLFFLEMKKNSIETKYNNTISKIILKRNLFYKEHNSSPPNLKHACYLLSYFNKNDIYELKNLMKQYKKDYEIIISILCIFLNIKPKIYIDDEGKKIIDFYSVGRNLVYEKDFIKIIQNINLDSLNYQTFSEIEKIMQTEAFSYEKLNNYSPCLIHLINLEMGIMEYFKAIRKYCLSFYDYSILDKEEIYFCQKMDELLKKYYVIKNYTFNKCQKYHQKSIDFLKKIDLEQNFNGEIQDFDLEINIQNNNEENNINNNNINNGMDNNIY